MQERRQRNQRRSRVTSEFTLLEGGGAFSNAAEHGLTHKSTEAAVSAAHPSKSEDVPEYCHPDGGHPQSVDGTAG